MERCWSFPSRTSNTYRATRRPRAFRATRSRRPASATSGIGPSSGPGPGRKRERSELVEGADREHLGVVQLVDVDQVVFGAQADAGEREPYADAVEWRGAVKIPARPADGF